MNIFFVYNLKLNKSLEILTNNRINPTIPIYIIHDKIINFTHV